MVRFFCDCCGKEIPEDYNMFKNPLHGRLSTKLKRGNSELTVQVIEYKDGVSNSGHFCHHCVLDALYTLDDRAAPDSSIMHGIFRSANLKKTVTVKAWFEVRDGKLVGMHQISEAYSSGGTVESPAKETGVIASLK